MADPAALRASIPGKKEKAVVVRHGLKAVTKACPK
jgi:hypothetical protein